MERYWEHYTDPLPQGLVDALRENRLVAFLGAGTSRRCLTKKRAPLPDWPGLIAELIQWGATRGLVDPKACVDLDELCSRGELTMAAQECRELIGDALLGEFISEVFDPDGVVPSRMHELLAAVPFHGYVTTNYDNLLERAATRVHRRQLRTLAPAGIGSFSDDQLRSRPVLKLHGDIDDPATVVLAHRDYQRVAWNPDYQALLASLLVDYTFLFVGYGLSDLDLLMPLDRLVYDGADMTHYLLCRRGSRNGVEKKRLRLDRHIEVVEYTDYFGFHNHVDTFLEGLLHETGNDSCLERVRSELRARIHVHYAPVDKEDGLFVWNYLFREGAVTLSVEPQMNQLQRLVESLDKGLRALDHLVFLVTPDGLANREFTDVVARALPIADAANVLVVFLCVGFDSRPSELADTVAARPTFLLADGFSECDLEPIRGYLEQDLRGGYRQA